MSRLKARLTTVALLATTAVLSASPAFAGIKNMGL